MRTCLTLAIAAIAVVLVSSTASAAVFKDLPTDSWAYAVIEECGSQGLCYWGWSGTNPHPSITRYEAALLTVRMLEELADDKLMAKVDYDTGLQLLGLIGVFESDLKEMQALAAERGMEFDWPKEQIARLADEKLFIPLIGE